MTQENNWEKEFDEFYTLPENMIPGPQRENAIKKFISSLLQSEKEKLAEQIINEIPDGIYVFDDIPLKQQLRDKYLNN